jgi:hypothetical protein
MEIWTTFIKYREGSRSSSAGSEMADSLSRVCAKLREWKPLPAQTTCSAKGEAPSATAKGSATKRKPTKAVVPPVKRNPGKKKAAAVNPAPSEKVASPEIASLLRNEMGSVFALIGIHYSLPASL